MPSFLENHVSEPVNLTASESSPYEPPPRKSQEQSWFYGARPIGSIIEGVPNGGLTNGRQSEEIRPRLADEKHQNLQSLPNGRSSGSTDRLGKAHSKHDSSHSLPAGADGIPEHGTEMNAEHCRASKPGSVNQQPPNVDGAATQSAKPDPPVSVRKSQDGPGRRAGHARGHSSSAPQSPSSYTIHSGGAEVGQQSVRTEAGPPVGRNDNQSTSRFSSPPTLPQSSPTALSSSGTPVHPGAVRLQHRHTLQVPKLSTGRTSRDFSGPITSSSDQTPVDIERLSPTHAGRGSTSLARRPTRSIHSDMYLDEIPQDDEMARWTETIRQKRASRRKRKDEEEDDRVVVGTKVDMNHVNWVTAYNMLTGIRFTVSRTNAKMDRELTDSDFDARHKFSFDM